MKTLIAIAILVLVATSLGGSVWAGTTTEGLTSVGVAVRAVATGGFDYEFTVFNNSTDAFTDWNVLIGELNIYNVVAGAAPNLLAPVSASSPNGWSWDLNGKAWKSQSVISYDPISNNIKYWSPPSIAPGSSLSGFVLHYNSAFDIKAFDYQTHVYAVKPLTGPITVPQWYEKTSVYLNPSVYGSNVTGLANTWWDNPADRGANNTGTTAVPEPTALMLGALGLLGPMGYALKRKKASS